MSAEKEEEFWCYPCSKGCCEECDGIAWRPDIPCRHAHFGEVTA